MRAPLLLLLVYCSMMSCTVTTTWPLELPKDYIPNEKVAVKLGKIILYEVFGRRYVNSFNPYQAILEDETWKVYGSLPVKVRGGTPYIEIQKSDGKIILVTHQK